MDQKQIDQVVEAVVAKVGASQSGGLSAITGNGSPMLFILMMMLLGGQGVDFITSNEGAAELRELRSDVEDALQEITDNSERIGRLETRVDAIAATVQTHDRKISDTERDVRELQTTTEALEDSLP